MTTEIKQAIETLRAGGLILYPTDTIWGIGCDASNAAAVQKIYALKQREEAKALITMVGSEVMLERSVENMPEIAWDLIDASDRPLTIIYDKVKGIASNAIAEDGSCAVRLPKDEFCQKLIQGFGKAIISTSANVSGEDSPPSFSEISKTILTGVDYVVNLRQSEKGENTPSSIIKLRNNGEIKIIR
jgi:L-threonylcarbamoyladenylate synthase